MNFCKRTAKGGSKLVAQICVLALLFSLAFPLPLSLSARATAESGALVKEGLAYTVTASSEKSGYAAQNANDSDYATYWQARGKENETLTADLGKVFSLREIRQTFENKDVWKFTIEGSLDGEEWAVLVDESAGKPGITFDSEAAGYYRFVRLNVIGSAESHNVTSRELVIVGTDMTEGTNIAEGMWASGDSWLPGYEPEKAFDGSLGTYYVANDGSYPHYIAVEWSYDCYVKSVDVVFKDHSTYEFEVEARQNSNDWIKLRERALFTGQRATIAVDKNVNAVLYRVFSGTGWANAVEIEVNGFKDLAAKNPAVFAEDGSWTVDLGAQTYVSKILQQSTGAYLLEGTNTDGEAAAWTTIAAAEDSAEIPVGAAYRYLRCTPTDAAELAAPQIYGTPFTRDLARGIRGEVSDYSNEGFNATKPTMNPEHRDKASSFWCASYSGGEHWFQVDLGRTSIIESVTQKFQDPGSYKFAVEVSKDGKSWVKLHDGLGEPVTGQAFTYYTDPADRLYRYARLYTKDIEWANSNQFSVNGIGSPLKENWWETESGIIRYYVKKQKLTLNEITADIKELQKQGYRGIELHQPYEGAPDIWAGLGATDNYAVDPTAGTKDDLVRLIDTAHAHGIKVIIFGNVGYARVSAPFFEKACKDYARGINTKESNWFHFSKTNPDPSKWFWSDAAQAYYYGYWGENGAIPSYNFNNQAWRDECASYIEYWTAIGADGVALDAPEVYDGFEAEDAKSISDTYITNIMNRFNIWTNPEGARDPAKWVGSWNFKCMQDYSLGNWGGGAWSLALDSAIDQKTTDANGAPIDDVLKNYRDVANNFNGITLAPMCFEPRYDNATYAQRALEAAMLTTVGNMFYIHNGSDAYIGQDIIAGWPVEARERIFDSMRTQNANGALAPGGLRVKIKTDADLKYYAFLKTSKSGRLKSIVILNFQNAQQDITLDLSNFGIKNQIPVDMATGKAGKAIEGNSYTVTLPAYGYTTLGVM